LENKRKKKDEYRPHVMVKLEKCQWNFIKKYCLDNNFFLNTFIIIMVLRGLFNKKGRAKIFETRVVDVPVDFHAELRNIKPPNITMADFLGEIVSDVLADESLIPKKGERSPLWKTWYKKPPASRSIKRHNASFKKRKTNPPKCLIVDD
jgi:hypothetical protein